MEIEFINPQEEISTSVWDKLVPIVPKGRREWHVYIQHAISNPEEYNELCYLLDSAYRGDTIYIHLNTPGGIIDSAFKIINSIKNTEADTVAVLTGTVASAGTIIALSCDSLEIAPFTQFMIHNYSGGTGGKGHEIRDYVKFSDKQLNKAFTSIYLGFLTSQEIHEVIEGRDIWLDEDEVLERWEKMHTEQVS